MKDDIETVRSIITHHVMRGTPVQREALAALERVEKRFIDYPLQARRLLEAEAERDSLRAKLGKAKPIIEAYARANPKWKPWQRPEQDPNGAHALLAELSADTPAQQTQRDVITRDKDIILQALAEYDAWMLDDDYDATTALHKIMKRMRDRALVEPAQQTQISDD